jgi:hypothetical protein
MNAGRLKLSTIAYFSLQVKNKLNDGTAFLTVILGASVVKNN